MKADASYGCETSHVNGVMLTNTALIVSREFVRIEELPLNVLSGSIRIVALTFETNLFINLSVFY